MLDLTAIILGVSGITLGIALWVGLFYHIGYYPGWLQKEPPEEPHITREEFEERWARTLALGEATAESYRHYGQWNGGWVYPDPP